MTNDREGNLYVATFGGSKIVKFNPRYAKNSFNTYLYDRNDGIQLINLISRTRKVLMEIPMPATQITSLAFGV